MLDNVRATAIRRFEEARSAHGQLPELVQLGQVPVWLKSARRAQVALAVALVVGLWVMPWLRDGLIELVFPAETQSSGFLGLSRSQVEHPAAAPVRIVLTVLYWGASLAWVVYLLWVDIPAALRRARAGAAATEASGSWGANVLDSDTLGTEATILPESREAPPASGVGTRPQALDATVLPGETAAAAPPRAPSSSASPGAASQPTARDIQPGEHLADRYRITRQLGEGGMGQVFLAEDETLGRQVALKKLPAELLGREEIRERFRREARALAQLNHPHVVQLFDFLDRSDGLWMIMEVVSGGDLEQRMEGEQLSLAEACRLGAQVARALEAAHARGVVHRDFKPANVMLTEQGDAKVTDFGIAKLEADSQAVDTKLTQAGTLMGTPTYMSPEQARGTDVGPATDVYSLGATLYEMITGAPLFEGTLTQVIAAHITERPLEFEEREIEAPAGLQKLVFGMLEKEPADRPPLPEVVATLERQATATAERVVSTH